LDHAPAGFCSGQLRGGPKPAGQACKWRRTRKE